MAVAQRFDDVEGDPDPLLKRLDDNSDLWNGPPDEILDQPSPFSRGTRELDPGMLYYAGPERDPFIYRSSDFDTSTSCDPAAYAHEDARNNALAEQHNLQTNLGLTGDPEIFKSLQEKLDQVNALLDSIDQQHAYDAQTLRRCRI